MNWLYRNITNKSLKTVPQIPLTVALKIFFCILLDTFLSDLFITFHTFTFIKG